LATEIEAKEAVERAINKNFIERVGIWLYYNERGVE